MNEILAILGLGSIIAIIPVGVTVSLLINKNKPMLQDTDMQCSCMGYRSHQMGCYAYSPGWFSRNFVVEQKK